MASTHPQDGTHACRGVSTPSPSPPADRKLRVLSCNLLSGRVPASELSKLLEHYKVDLACPQELGARGADAIASVLPEGQLAPDAGARGLGIAARAAVRVRRLRLPGRPAWVARLDPVDWPQLERPIEIVNVHILAPHMWPYFPRRARRSAQLAGLLAHIHADSETPRAVVGDFNATPWWPLYKSMVAVYRDGVRELLPRPPRTWPAAGRLPFPGLLRIDHCFVSGLRVVHAQRIPLPRSDHYGLLIDLVVSGAQDSPPRAAARPASG